jgi:radical SAM protein with 4Fe4S-binding SPASM domain
MYVRQCRDTFIRRFGDLGYITSQLTGFDRVYDEIGAVFLSTLSRTPRSLEELVEELVGLFGEDARQDIAVDLLEFLRELQSERFVVLAEQLDELDGLDVGFTYTADAPRTAALRVLGRERDTAARPSSDVMLDHFRDHPAIFGAHVELTSRCNERCVHCYQDHSGGRHAETDVVLDLFEQLEQMGTASVTLSGGEPTLHPQFVEILRAARGRDFMVNILTNGLRLDDRILDAIRDANINMIQVSLYSMDPEVHDGITGIGGSHERTVATVEALIEREVPVQISCPLMKQNQDCYRAVSAWCRERNVRVLSDFVMMARSDFDTSNLAQRLDLDETRKVMSDILVVDDEYQLLLEAEPKTADLDAFAKQPVCGVCIDNACFTVDGKMYPCSGFRGFVLGDIKEKAVREIWEDAEPVSFLRSLRNDSFPKCLGCEARDFCIMCLVRNYNESGGDMFAVADHFCDVAFLNKELVEGFKASRQVDEG